MNVNLGHHPDAKRLQELVRDLEQIFELIPENVRFPFTAELTFAAPGAVPGITTQTVDIMDVEVGDTIAIAPQFAVPAGFMPPAAAINADGTVTVYWLQVSGAPASPDGGLGGAYNIDVWRH